MTELARLTWPEARRAIVSSCIGLLPVGATEQHGPHLPLETDLIIAREIAAQAAQTAGRLLLPSLPVGVSHEHGQFWGTLTVSAEVLRELVLGIVRSAAAHGLRRFVLVNGHGTNCAPLDDAARILRREGISTYVFNWWQALGATLSSLGLDPVDHAGPVETSLLLAIDPHLVRADQIPSAGRADRWGVYVEGVQVQFDTIGFSPEGNVGNPRRAGAETGAILLRESTAALGRFCDWLAEQPEADLELAGHAP